MSRRKIVIIYLVLLLYTFAPLLCALTASGIAQATGSTIDESGSHPCIILGHDIGPLLGSMFVCGWFSLITLPSGGLSLICFTISILISRARARRKAKANR